MAERNVEILLKLAAREFRREIASTREEYNRELGEMERGTKKLDDALNKVDAKAVREIEEDAKDTARALDGLGKTARTSGRTVKTELDSAGRAARELGRTGRDSSREVERGQRRVREEVQRVDRATADATSTFRTFGTVIGGTIAVGLIIRSIRSVVALNDEYLKLEGRLRLVTDSQEELGEVQQGLFEIAQRTGSEFAPLVELYARVARNADTLGLAQGQLLTLTTAVSQSIQISGSTTTEAASGVLQFSQALASGVLRGDELRSVLENNSRLARALADGLGVNIGQLRQLGEEGELTADRVVGALLTQVETLDAEFQQLPVTVGRAVTALTNEIERAVAEGDTSQLVASIDELRRIVADPNFQESITALVDALIRLGSGSATLISESVKATENLGEAAARLIAGPLDDVSELEAGIERLQRANLNAFTRARVFTDPVGTLVFPSEAEIEDRIRQLEEARQRLLGLGNADTIASSAEAERQRRGLTRQVEGELRQLAGLQARLSEAVAEEEIEGRKSVLKEVISTSQQAIRQKQAELRTLVQEEERAAERIKSLRREIADIQLSVETRIRDRRRQGLSEAEQQADIEREIADRVGSARAAIDEGDLGAAQRFADRVAALSDQVADLDAADAALQEAGRIQVQIRQEEIRAEEAASAARQRAIEQLQESITALTSRVGTAKAELAGLEDVAPSVEIRDNIDEVLERLRTLKSELDSLDGFASLEGRREGGPVGFARGGQLPGFGGGDRRLILAEDGEFVIRKEAVRRYGPGLFRALNSLRLPAFRAGGLVRPPLIPRVPSLPRFQEGGEVGGTGAGGETVRLELSLGGGQDFTLLGARDQVRGLVDALAEASRGG